MPWMCASLAAGRGCSLRRSDGARAHAERIASRASHDAIPRACCAEKSPSEVEREGQTTSPTRNEGEILARGGPPTSVKKYTRQGCAALTLKTAQRPLKPAPLRVSGRAASCVSRMCFQRATRRLEITGPSRASLGECGSTLRLGVTFTVTINALAQYRCEVHPLPRGALPGRGWVCGRLNRSPSEVQARRHRPTRKSLPIRRASRRPRRSDHPPFNDIRGETTPRPIRRDHARGCSTSMAMATQRAITRSR